MATETYSQDLDDELTEEKYETAGQLLDALRMALPDKAHHDESYVVVTGDQIGAMGEAVRLARQFVRVADRLAAIGVEVNEAPEHPKEYAASLARLAPRV